MTHCSSSSAPLCFRKALQEIVGNSNKPAIGSPLHQHLCFSSTFPWALHSPWPLQLSRMILCTKYWEMRLRRANPIGLHVGHGLPHEPTPESMWENKKGITRSESTLGPLAGAQLNFIYLLGERKRTVECFYFAHGVKTEGCKYVPKSYHGYTHF